ncbi:histidine phosphatase family protein [Paratractidigestivibacter sp.]|uniref:histidine phosphatase family protein n=1 Tax=Paratractidigestivibacter sp. TaxID=2847316 RepID=UPI002ABDC645|nr:histidine phosphatase family protein [Paratractidigestivibacter sp.]
MVFREVCRHGLYGRSGVALMKRLYLVRHGQTEFNLVRRVQGRCDSSLTELGVRQAHAAGAWLREHGASPDAMVSSPLGRALATARVLADELGFIGEVLPEPRIIERSYGRFEEGPFSELPCDVWDPGEELVAHGGEGNRALRIRMLEGLRDLMGRQNVRCAVAVSHGSASRQFIAMNLPDGAPAPGRLPNCGIFAFDYDEPADSFELLSITDPLA